MEDSLMTTQTWAQYIACELQRALHFRSKDDVRSKHILKDLCLDIAKYGPSGSGFDNGAVLHHTSTPTRFVFLMCFHHMDEHGGYKGWTSHSVVTTPCFTGFDLRVTGRNQNGIKELIANTFHHWLTQLHIDQFP
jgi:hypothetical protein